MKQKPRVLVAMSGGVDSSVAALIMKKQGYDVIGAFMKNWSDTKNNLGECTWRGERRVALKIASILDIPLITLDFEKQYRKLVVNEMYKKYKKGITPNPDIDCNEKVKFPLLIKAAKKLKCDYLVTGHYARIKRTYGSSYDISLKNRSPLTIKNKYVSNSEPNSGGAASNFARQNCKTHNERDCELGNKFQYSLLRAKDESKDQSYFLYRLKQSELAKTQFPVGNLTKVQVREIARKNKFPNYNKKSTVGICFIGKVNLKRFLQKKIKPKPGRILDPEGNQIGTHDGIFYYTIGQRIGSRFGIEVLKLEKRQKRWYVARKNAKTNTIIAAPEDHEFNFRKEIYVNDAYWINGDFINSLIENNRDDNKNSKKNSVLALNDKSISERSEPISGGVGGGKFIQVLSRIRQVGELLHSKISIKKGKILVTLNKPITGVSEGQAIVLYKDKEVLGGGVISFSQQ